MIIVEDNKSDGLLILILLEYLFIALAFKFAIVVARAAKERGEKNGSQTKKLWRRSSNARNE